MKVLVAMCWMLLLTFSNCIAQSSAQKINNLKAFAKVYGYVRYFYPGDEAAALDWEKFVYYGVKQVEPAKNSSELNKVLNRLFSPVAPAVQISLRNKKNVYTDPRPADTTHFYPVYWEHYGFHGNTTTFRDPYANQRRNRKDSGYSVFEQIPGYSEIFHADIANNVELFMPLVLPGDSLHTYPVANETALLELNRHMIKTWPLTPAGSDLYLRISDIILLWNALKHFNPHWQYADIKPEAFIENGLRRCYSDKTSLDFFNTLKYLMEPFNDSHVGFGVDFFDSAYRVYTIPVRFANVGDQILVDYCTDSILGKYFKSGDIVESIDGEDPMRRMQRIEKEFSGSPQLKKWIAVAWLCTDTASSISIKLADKEAATFKKNIRAGQFNTRQVKRKQTGWISDDVFYLDLDNATDSVYKLRIPEILKAKVLICDLRNYPKGNYVVDLIQKLLRKPANKDWMFIPEIIYPDQRQVSFDPDKWYMLPDTNNPIKAKVYLLISSRSISFAESVTGHFRYYQLATIIGQPTAGANGNVTFLQLPGNYRIGWTQMLVKQQNGEQLFAKGFTPDIYVERTSQGIKENLDEVMERALTEARKYLKQ